MAKKVIVAYIPVIHRGYRQLLEANPDHHSLYILDTDITSRDRSLQKEVRALTPTQARQALISWNLLDEITVANAATLRYLATSGAHILMPDDDISYALASEFFEHNKVSFYPIFLRWDRRAITAKNSINPDHTVSRAELDQQFMRLAHAEGFKSSDIWRRVGALMVQNGAITDIAYNNSKPHQHMTWLYGDPRGNSQQGEAINNSLFQHAEAQLVANAAKAGRSLAGADMYVNTFPCAPCAMLVAGSGVGRLFYTQGYGMLAGERALKEAGVQIIRVETELVDDLPESYVPYLSSP